MKMKIFSMRKNIIYIKNYFIEIRNKLLNHSSIYFGIIIQIHLILDLNVDGRLEGPFSENAEFQHQFFFRENTIREQKI